MSANCRNAPLIGLAFLNIFLFLCIFRIYGKLNDLDKLIVQKFKTLERHSPLHEESPLNSLSEVHPTTIELYQSQSQIRKQKLKALKDTHGWLVLYNVLVPEVFCSKIRIGTVIDGGKWVCNPIHMRKFEACTVYSMGIHNEPSFEEEFAKFTHKKCFIRSFDKDNQNPQTLKKIENSNGTFMKALISSETNKSANSYNMRSLMEIFQDKKIDILKIDIEGFEYQIIEDLTSIPMCQILIEVHGRTPTRTLEFLRKISQSGYYLFNYEINGALHKLTDILDEAFVKKGIAEDLKNEEIDPEAIFDKNTDKTIKFVEDPFDWIYTLDYNKSHPFDNQCRFPVIRHDDKELQKYILHYRETDCSKFSNEESPLVHQHRNGEILVAKPNRGLIKDFSCFYRELSGAVRPKTSVSIEVGNWTKIPIGKRVLIQKDQFLIQCLSKGNRVYLNAFSWVSDKPRLNPPVISGENKYSISLLIIDSTSRNQFFRHMPLTLRWMRERDFQILQGYTKVWDNSAMNLFVILSGLVFGARFKGLVEDDGAIELKAIKEDFSLVNISLIARAKAVGCATLWNDEIANPGFGLFHYDYFKGFHSPIADYYYRPYYQYIYKNLNASSGCKNGQPILPKWLELWEQFSTKYSDKCHFAFNFLTGLTHASGNNLELYDIPVSDALGRMEAAGVLENTFLVIMGDHGQRISPIQKTTIGRIEERMSFFGIHIPEKFKLQYPEKFQNFVKNRNRLTSNFDVHETFEEIFALTTGDNHKKPTSHGISLFEEIPKNRTCKDAFIPKNFCMCMDKVEAAPRKGFEDSLKYLAADYLKTSLNDTCISSYQYTISSARTWYTISKMSKVGIRYIHEWEKVKNKDKIARDVFEIEFTIELRIRQKVKKEELDMKLLMRVQYSNKTQEMQLNSPPWLQSELCPETFILEELCKCLN